MEQKIFITVQAGLAEVCEDTVPTGLHVEILDFDHLRTKPEDEIACWSAELYQYWLMNHQKWGRCEVGCPCKQLLQKRPAVT